MSPDAQHQLLVDAPQQSVVAASAAPVAGQQQLSVPSERSSSERNPTAPRASYRIPPFMKRMRLPPPQLAGTIVARLKTMLQTRHPKTSNVAAVELGSNTPPRGGSPLPRSSPAAADLEANNTTGTYPQRVGRIRYCVRAMFEWMVGLLLLLWGLMLFTLPFIDHAAQCALEGVIIVIIGQQILVAAHGEASVWAIPLVWAARYGAVGGAAMSPLGFSLSCCFVVQEVFLLRQVLNVALCAAAGAVGSAILRGHGREDAMLSMGQAAIAAMVGTAVLVVPLRLLERLCKYLKDDD